MGEPGKVFAPEVASAESNRWIGWLTIAVVLGIGLWNFVVSLTENVVLPALARVMEGDPNSPLYLGNGNYHLGTFFGSVLELCFALIVAAIVSAVSRRTPKVRRVRVRMAPPAPSVSIVPATQPANRSVPATASAEPAQPLPKPPAPVQAKPAPPAPPAKPKKPKEITYNLVGEPVDSED